MLVNALKQFCKKIGVGEQEVKSFETPDLLNLSLKLSAGSFNQLLPQDFNALQQVFGETLNVVIGLEASPYPLIQIEQGRVLTSLDGGLETLKQRPTTTDIRFKLRIDKSSILNQLSVTGDGHHSLFYFFMDNVDGLFRAPLLQLDELLFKAKSKPCLIVVSEEGDRFNGNLLHVVSEDRADDFRKMPPRISKDLQEQLDRFYANDLSRPSWIGFNLKHLTPLHFVGDWIGGEKDTHEAIAAAHLLDLCILFTANRSSYDEQKKSFQSIYASSDRTVTLDFVRHLANPKTMQTLTAFADWVSSSKDKDRLAIFQNITARLITSDDSVENYKLFTSILPRIYSETCWHYRIFLDGQISKHFEEVQKLSSYVAEIAKKISENIDLVTKSVTDTLLATVAVLVITVLAALVKNEASNSIFMISLRVYAGYLVFYALYRMGSIGHSYVLLKQDAEEQIVIYEPKLSKDKVQKLAKPITRRKFQFYGWFWATTILYLVLAITLWKAGNRVPQYLIDKGLIKPAATPSPIPTPAPTEKPSSTVSHLH